MPKLEHLSSGTGRNIVHSETPIIYIHIYIIYIILYIAIIFLFFNIDMKLKYVMQKNHDFKSILS